MSSPLLVSAVEYLNAFSKRGRYLTGVGGHLLTSIALNSLRSFAISSLTCDSLDRDRETGPNHVDVPVQQHLHQSVPRSVDLLAVTPVERVDVGDLKAVLVAQRVQHVVDEPLGRFVLEGLDEGSGDDGSYLELCTF